MKILVAVKQVSLLDDDFELLENGEGVDPDYIEHDINEWDLFSLETALRLRESQQADGEIIVVTVGGEQAEEVLRTCLARGADRAIRVEGDRLRFYDPFTVARLLSAVAENEAPDLILCGVQSSDAVNGATGIAMAGYLGRPHVAVVKEIRLAVGNDTAHVKRELESGLTEMLEVPLPALFTVQTGINQPRYANLRAIKQAREKPVCVVTPEKIGLDDAAIDAVAGSSPYRLRQPESTASATMLDGGAAEVATEILTIVRERLT